MFLKPKSYFSLVNSPLYKSLHHWKNWVPSLLPSSLFYDSTLACPLYPDPVKTHYPTVISHWDLTAWKPLSSGCFRCDSHLTHQLICLQSETGNAALGLIRGQKFKHTGTCMSAYLICVRMHACLCVSTHVCVYMCVQVYVDICICYLGILVCVYEFLCTYMFINMHVCPYVWIFMYPSSPNSAPPYIYLSALISLINLFLLKLPPAAPAEQTHKQKKALFNTFQWQYWGLQTLIIVTMTGQAYVTCPAWVSESSPPEANSEAMRPGGEGVIPSGKSDRFIKDAGQARPSQDLSLLDPPS